MTPTAPPEERDDPDGSGRRPPLPAGGTPPPLLPVGAGGDAPPTDILAGPLRRPLLRLALPMMAGYVFQIGFNLVDTFFVGSLGADPLGAVGSTMYVVWALIAVVELVSVGTLALVARAVGARDPQAAGAAALVGAAGALGLGLVGALLEPWLVPAIVDPLGLEPQTAALARSYLGILVLGYPTLSGFFFLESTFRGAGETRLPMLVLVGALVLNAVLDYALIFGAGPLPAMGVRGAALATVLSRGTGCLVLLACLWRLRRGLGLGAPAPGALRPRAALRLLGRIVRIGAPASLAGLSFCGIYMVLVWYTNDVGGTVAVAAMGLGVRIESLSYMVFISLGRAAGTIAGQCLGAGDRERARAAARLACGYGVVAVLPLITAFLLGPRAIVGVFVDDPGVRDAGTSYLLIVAPTLLPFALEVVLDNVAAGVGDTVPAMAIEVVGTVLRLPLAMALVALGLGYTAIWWAIAATMVLKGLAFVVWYRRGRWLEVGA